MRALFDLIFPPRCAGCDSPGTLLCARCTAALPLIDPAAACPTCGAPIVAPVPTSVGLAALGSGERPTAAVPCIECHGRSFAFRSARCAALLEPPVSRAVVVLKDGGERRYAEVLAELLAECTRGWLAEGDTLVPVPATPAAVRRRGFDHAFDIARALGRRTGNPVSRPLRARAGVDQRTLGRGDRFANRADAFRTERAVSPTARLILVDDVFTTGATMDAAARTLLAAGATDVRALAVARSCSRRDMGDASESGVSGA